ncbi:MAG: hypothetical protein WC082_09440 [Victivallales bacterium]
MNLIDCSSWYGKWPFKDLRYSDLPTMENKLKSCGIKKVFISPLDAVFSQAAHDANDKLDELLGDNAFFSLVPVIDLMMPDWREAVDKAIAAENVKIIKLLPEYHLYELNEEKLEELVEKTSASGLVISVPFKIEDPRGQYPLLDIKGLDPVKTAKVLSYFRQQKFIINNAYWRDLNDIYYILENACFDIAMLEPVPPLKKIKEKYSLERFVFAANCPLFYPEGNLNKLKYAGLPQEDIDKVAFKNIEKLLTRRTIRCLIHQNHGINIKTA